MPKSSSSLNGSIALLLTVLATPIAGAAPYTWDSNLGIAGAQDGSGTWDTVTTNWINAGANAVWSNANDATFGAGIDGSYAVNVALNPSATSLIFNNSGYTLSACLLYTSPSPRDGLLSRMPSSA